MEKGEVFKTYDRFECPKCGNAIFSRKTIHFEKSAETQNVIVCSSCGAYIGIDNSELLNCIYNDVFALSAHVKI
jgi:hypothetical protein